MIYYYFLKSTHKRVRIVVFSQIKNIQNIPKKLYTRGSSYCVKQFLGFYSGLNS